MGQIALSPKKGTSDAYTAEDTTGRTAAPDTANLASDLVLQKLQAATAKHELLLRQVDESKLSILALAAQTPAGTSTHDTFPTALHTAYPTSAATTVAATAPAVVQAQLPTTPTKKKNCTTPSSLLKLPTWFSLAR